MTKLQTLLVSRHACPEAVERVGGKALQEAWATCERGDWMLWLCGMQALLLSLEELHYLTEAQRDITNLAEEITRCQRRLEEIRKDHPQLALSSTQE